MENYLKEKNNANIAKQRAIIHKSIGALANTVEDQAIKKNCRFKDKKSNPTNRANKADEKKGKLRR